LIRDAFFEGQRSFGSFRGCFRTEESRQRSSRDQKGSYAKEEKDCGARTKKPAFAEASAARYGSAFADRPSRKAMAYRAATADKLASGFLLHCKWMNFEPPLVAQMPDGVKHFPVFLERELLSA
jgi:hypothetical protein